MATNGISPELSEIEFNNLVNTLVETPTLHPSSENPMRQLAEYYHTNGLDILTQLDLSVIQNKPDQETSNPPKDSNQKKRKLSIKPNETDTEKLARYENEKKKLKDLIAKADESFCLIDRLLNISKNEIRLRKKRTVNSRSRYKEKLKHLEGQIQLIKADQEITALKEENALLRARCDLLEEKANNTQPTHSTSLTTAVANLFFNYRETDQTDSGTVLSCENRTMTNPIFRP